MNIINRIIYLTLCFQMIFNITFDNSFKVTKLKKCDADRVVTVNYIDYYQYNSTGKFGDIDVYTGDTQIRTDKNGDRYLEDMGCGIYCTSSILSAYKCQAWTPEEVCKYMHNNLGNDAYNNDGRRFNTILTMLNNLGIKGNISSSKEDFSQAILDNKPIIVRIQGLPSDTDDRLWSSPGGHFLLFCGISPDGTIYTADSNVDRKTKRISCKMGKNKKKAIDKTWDELNKYFPCTIWIPEMNPNEFKATSYEISIKKTQMYPY